MKNLMLVSYISGYSLLMIAAFRNKFWKILIGYAVFFIIGLLGLLEISLLGG